MIQAEKSRADFGPLLIGKSIRSLYHTEKEISEEFMFRELAHNFRTVMELDSGERFEFSTKKIRPFPEDAELHLIEAGDPEFGFKDEYKGQLISEIGLDEYGELYFLLKNGYILYCAEIVGTQLFLKKYEEVFDENGRYRDD